MLNVFPVLFLSLLAHAILRVCVGGILVYLGLRHITKERIGLHILFKEHWPNAATFLVWYFAIVELVAGMFLIVGAWTQIATLVTLFFSVKMLVLRKYMAHPSIPPPLFYVLLLGASFSLFITGAGAFAFDLPI